MSAPHGKYTIPTTALDDFAKSINAALEICKDIKVDHTSKCKTCITSTVGIPLGMQVDTSSNTLPGILPNMEACDTYGDVEMLADTCKAMLRVVDNHASPVKNNGSDNTSRSEMPDSDFARVDACSFAAHDDEHTRLQNMIAARRAALREQPTANVQPLGKPPLSPPRLERAGAWSFARVDDLDHLDDMFATLQRRGRTGKKEDAMVVDL
jgi:hypothetical protein